MKGWRAILTGAIVGGTLAGCGSGLSGTSSASTPEETSSTPASQPASGGSLAAAAVYLRASTPVAFTGETVALTIQQSAGTAAAQWIRLASATVSLGDGTTASARGRCTGGSLPAPSTGLVVHHAYHHTGVMTVRVAAVSTCTRRSPPDLSGATVAMRVLPAAPLASASWPQCGASQIRVSATSKGAALGHVGVLFTLRNASSASCRLRGYPGLQMLGSNGDQLPTTVVRAVNGAYLLAPVVPHWVALPPGAVGSFDLQYGDVPQGAQANEPYPTACPTAQQIQVTLPNAHDHTVVPAPAHMAPCGGEVLVSPVVPGSQWLGP